MFYWSPKNVELTKKIFVRNTQNGVLLYVFKIFNGLNMSFGLVTDLRLQKQP